MDPKGSLFIAFILVTQTAGNFINFHTGYEYIYHFTSDAEIKDLENFQTNAKISFTAIQKTNACQELLLKVYKFELKAGKHTANGNDDERFDFSKWFSFEITPYGEIKTVYHPEEENIDVLLAKKGLASLLASKLLNNEEIGQGGDEWRYHTQETGNEGDHNATYQVIKTPTGVEFKKFRKSSPLPNAKGNHLKTLHFSHDLGTIHSVLVEEDFTSPQISLDFDPYHNQRKFEAVNDFNTMEYPIMSASHRGKLKFLSRQEVIGVEYKPMDKVINGTVHTGKYKQKFKPMTIVAMKKNITASVNCIREEPDRGSSLVLSCFHSLVELIANLPDEELEKLAKKYFVQMRPITQKNKENVAIMVDAFAAIASDHSQLLLAKMVIWNRKPEERFILRLMSHISGYDTPPHQNLIDGMEDLCFHKEKFPESLYTGDLYNRVLLALGSVIHKLWREGDMERAVTITNKIQNMIGFHDPWIYKMKRAALTDSKKDEYDLSRVVLLETLGNARMDSSFHIIISHINSTNSPWIKRAGVHALRKYEHHMAADEMLKAALYDEDENVRYEALLLYQTHPKSRVITPLNKRSADNVTGITDPYASDMDVQVHHRSRRGFWEGLKFKLSAPAVNWQMKIGNAALGASFGVIMENYLDLLISPLSGHFKVRAHDEVYAIIHAGLVGINLEFFVGRICYKGETSYSINIFQEGDVNKVLDRALRFDKVVKEIVGGIKKGIDLFFSIINGKLSIKSVVQKLIKTLKELPYKVADLRSKAINAVKTLGQFDESLFPSFMKSVKHLVQKVQTLFNDIKTDVMTFYNKLEEIIEIKFPILADRLYKSVLDVIDGFGILGKNPKSGLVKIGVGVFQIYQSYKEALEVKNKIQEACFFLKDEKPYWWDIKTEYIKIEKLAKKAIEMLGSTSNEWINDVKEDVVAKFTKGKYTLAMVKKDIIDDIRSLIDNLLNPFSYLEGLADPFIDAYEATFGVIKSIKEAHTILKEGYETGKSIFDSIFGSKVPQNFPRKFRLDTDGCRGDGFYPSSLKNGDTEYWSEGVDLEIGIGETVVAPFAGYVMLSDRPNEVRIQATGGSLKDIDVFVTNVEPVDTILHTNDDDYIENPISAGVTIGTATSSPCANHVHLTMKKNGKYIDPTRFLEDRPFTFQPYIERCNDYKLVYKFETRAVGKVIGENDKGEDDTTPDMPNSVVDLVDPPPADSDPGEDIRAAKDNPDGMFSKVKNSFSKPSLSGTFMSLIKKADSFIKRFSLKRLKLGSIIEFLDQLGMTESKQKLAEVLKSIKVISCSYLDVWGAGIFDGL